MSDPTETKTAKLSLLWIVLVLNYLYADVIGFFAPEMIRGVLDNNLGGIKVTPGLLLGSAILMEVPIAMILLSRVLEYRLNRWANIVTGVAYTGVTIFTTFLMATPAPYYLFFGVVEIIITISIAVCAWTWRPSSALLSSDAVESRAIDTS